MTTGRLIVFGSRRYPHRQRVEERVARLVQTLGIRTLVHGHCRTGADRFADDWAVNVAPHGLVRVERHPADFDGLGLKAGPIRNQAMADLDADHAVGFWDGKMERSGTLGMAKLLWKKHITVELVPATPTVETTLRILRRHTDWSEISSFIKKGHVVVL